MEKIIGITQCLFRKKIMTKAVIFDTETTGRKDPIIIEGAWLELKSVDPFNLGSSFCQRYNPGKPIELGALAISTL